MAKQSAWRRSAALAALALALTVGTALGAIRTGTDGNDTLVGTNGNDQVTGQAGDDTLKGRAGDDVYHFADGWGRDTVVEPARVKAGKQRVSGGIDTLNFAEATDRVAVTLVPEWGAHWNNAVANDSSQVDLGSAVVEKIVGGDGDDALAGGERDNTYHPGGGSYDVVTDYGGYDPNEGGMRPLRPSDDAYIGLAGHGGGVYVYDFGGTADRLDFRPLKRKDVTLTAVDLDNSGTAESLRAATGETTAVYVVGHFGPYRDLGPHGRVERLVFADRTITAPKSLGDAATGASSPDDRHGTAQQRVADPGPNHDRQRDPTPPPVDYRSAAGGKPRQP